MITEHVGDLLDNVERGFIIHGCNAQGKMGSGIALSIRKKWPEVYEAYERQYRKGHTHHLTGKHVPELELGTNIAVKVSPEIVVINAITQRYYRGHQMASSNVQQFVDYVAIASCFHDILRIKQEFSYISPTLHFPKIGAGLANGNWDIIVRLIEYNLRSMNKTLWILE